jgi:hypothetical protein
MAMTKDRQLFTIALRAQSDSQPTTGKQADSRNQQPAKQVTFPASNDIKLT